MKQLDPITDATPSPTKPRKRSKPKKSHNYSMTIGSLQVVRETTTAKAKAPADVYNLCKDMGRMAQEAVCVITLNTQNTVIDRHLISLGLLNASMVHPREVFRPSIADGAAAVIMVHNHPSGDSTPSGEDIRITKQLIEAGKIVDIKVQDHVIIGRPSEANRDGFESLRESGLVQFS